MPQALRGYVQHLPVGQVAAPVQGPGGWYIFKVLGRRPARIAPFSQVRAAVQAELTRRLRSAALDKWLTHARSAADITRT